MENKSRKKRIKMSRRTDGLFSVKFPYNEKVCTLIKEIEGRVFKPEYKEWQIDQQGVDVFINKLQKETIAYEIN